MHGRHSGGCRGQGRVMARFFLDGRLRLDGRALWINQLGNRMHNTMKDGINCTTGPTRRTRAARQLPAAPLSDEPRQAADMTHSTTQLGRSQVDRPCLDRHELEDPPELARALQGQEAHPP